MKTSTQIAIGIGVGLAAYLIYRIYANYTSTGNPLGGLSASNLQQPTTDTGGALDQPNAQNLVPTVPPSTGPATETRSGRGHF